MYLFNSTEWCYIKSTTDNVLQILLQASRWRVKTANTLLQIPWKGIHKNQTIILGRKRTFIQKEFKFEHWQTGQATCNLLIWYLKLYILLSIFLLFY
jgi:hypothetical protein